MDTPDIVVEPMPLITPLSPAYDMTVFFSSRTGSAPIRTTGGFASLYSVPAVETVILVTTPFVIDAVASARAVVPRPTGFWIVTVGTLSYPLPPVEIATDDIVPAADTIAVAAAANLSTLFTIIIFFGIQLIHYFHF